MKLKEKAAAEMAKEKEAGAQGDPYDEEKALSAEEEDNETFEGEMNDFQTPLVRCGPSAPVLFYVTYCPRFAPPRRVSILIQLSSLVPLVRLSTLPFL